MWDFFLSLQSPSKLPITVVIFLCLLNNKTVFHTTFVEKFSGLRDLVFNYIPPTVKRKLYKWTQNLWGQHWDEQYQQDSLQNFFSCSLVLEVSLTNLNPIITVHTCNGWPSCRSSTSSSDYSEDVKNISPYDYPLIFPSSDLPGYSQFFRQPHLKLASVWAFVLSSCPQLLLLPSYFFLQPQIMATGWKFSSSRFKINFISNSSSFTPVSDWKELAH